MFAVPGWNIAAKSVVQEQASGLSKKDALKAASEPPSASAQKNSAALNPKKRKRARDRPRQGLVPPSNEPLSQSSTIPVAPPSIKKHKKQHHDSYPGSSNPKQPRSKHDQETSRSNGKAVQTASPTQVASVVLTRSTSPQFQLGADPTTLRNALKKKQHQTNERRRHAESAQNATKNAAANPAKLNKSEPLPPMPPASTNLTALQAQMRAKLTAARFRHLNETLYTTSSQDALHLFTHSPDLFAEYHAGFSQQVKDSWPENPVDVFVQNIKLRGGLSSPVGDQWPLPRRKPGTCTIADLGCGDAPLARGLQSVIKKLKLRLHNYDLHAPNDLVTAADIASLPLKDGETDIAIFCLSLMGTNWLAFVEEAWRVLRGDGKGEVWVAEVKSRFGRLSARRGAHKVVENSVGRRRKSYAAKAEHSEEVDAETEPALAEESRPTANAAADDDTDLQPFIDSIQRRGFYLRDGSIDKSNKMFVSMAFTKSGIPRAGKWKGMKWNGKEYQRIENQQKRFIGGQRRIGADDEEIDEKEEGKLLKPCVYKLR